MLTTRFDGAASSRHPDELIVEEPMTIRIDDTTVATTMRTPGHDFELAAGFCYTDGQIGLDVVDAIRYCATGTAAETAYNTVSVETGGRGQPSPRLGTVSSSCGLCGSEAIDDLRARIHPLHDPVHFAPELLIKVSDEATTQQKLFARTGAVHGAGAFDEHGSFLVLREDIGRHNAVDKVVGRLLLDGRLPAHGLGLYVSGRASFEMVQKAWAAGFGSLVAVSAPSALAVDAARAARLQLAGFARGGRLNLYTPHEHLE